jgi:hypothetical protein
MSLTKFPNGIYASPIVGGGDIGMFAGNNIYFVDGDNGSDAYDGKSPDAAKATIQAAVTAAAAANVISKTGSVIYIKARYMAAGSANPVDYAETIIIPAAGGDRMALIGVPNGRTQGGLPQIRKGSGSTALLTIRAPGCLIANLGFNGSGSSGGGILLDDNGSTKTAFGTTIVNCHFKSCVGSSATNAATGGAIQWASTGGGWQTLIKGNRFYNNVGDVVLLGTSVAVPQDVVIEDNVFSGPAANTDCNLYLAAGSGMNGVIIRNNTFTAFPAISTGTNLTFIVATGCVGILDGNRFASNGKTFGAAGNVLIPTTMLMAQNYQEKSTSGSGEIFRT